MRVLACLIALAAILIGMASISWPGAEQPVCGGALVAYGVILLGVFAFSFQGAAGQTALRWFLGITLGLAVVVYALPQSLWRALGLRN